MNVDSSKSGSSVLISRKSMDGAHSGCEEVIAGAMASMVDANICQHR
jgi:hypothetical protein